MLTDFKSLLQLDEAAAPFGCRLNPKLAALLAERAAEAPAGTIPLPVEVVSSGPAHQHATEEDLAAAGVERLAPLRGAASTLIL